ncbi:hypothetical protein V8F20_011285 [Naviculisporaceae sp. PSN 640]
MEPTALPAGQRPFSTTPQTPKRRPEDNDDSQIAIAKKQRGMDCINPLPLTRDGTLQYKTKHQMIHQYNDRNHDVVLSKNDPTEVNFYAPRADKVGENFAGVIDASDEALGALVQTIKAEMGPEHQGRLITFNFAIISEDEHASTSIDRGVSGPARRLHDGKPTRMEFAPHARFSTNEGITSDLPGVVRSLPMPTSIKQEPTVTEPATPQPTHTGDQELQATPQQATARSCSVATTAPDQSRNITLPTLNGPNASNGLLCQLLQKQWPPYNHGLGPDFSTLGCFTTVYRNILRSLFNHDSPSRSVPQISELGTNFKGAKRKLWDYLWLDMNFPSDGPVHTAFHKRTTELIGKLKASMEQENEDNDEPAGAKFTFSALLSSTVSLNKLWETVDGLRLFRAGFFRDSAGGPWRQAPVDNFGFSSLIKYNSTQLSACFGDPESSLEMTINKLFQFQVGQGDFGPRGFDQPNIRLTCAFPAVIRVHYTSREFIPNDSDDEDNGIINTYDWLRDGPGRPLRGFTLLQERWNTKVADLPRRQQPYRLMAVVRMRNSPEEHDLVRIYSDVGECIHPMTSDLAYHSGKWSLSEPNREFMLYYTPCLYNACFPPAGMKFPETYENLE